MKNPDWSRSFEDECSRPSPVPDLDLASLNLLWIEPTSRCNLECVHCYSDSSPRATSMPGKDVLSVDDWVDVLSQASEIGCRIVQIGGGEPTLFPRLPALVEKARELGYRWVVLFTNATCLTESDLDELSVYNVELVTSFYSSHGDVHDAITQRQGSFDRTVGGIRSIINRGLPLEVSMVRMAQNDSQVESAIDFLVGLGVKREKIAVGPVRAAGRAATLESGQDPYSSLCGHCSARHLVVSSDGSIYPCILARWFPLGNVRTERLQSIIGNQRLIDFRTRARDKPQRT